MRESVTATVEKTPHGLRIHVEKAGFDGPVIEADITAMVSPFNAAHFDEPAFVKLIGDFALAARKIVESAYERGETK